MMSLKYPLTGNCSYYVDKVQYNCTLRRNKMTKAKMCLQCNRLVSLDTIECSCGGKEFIEVILGFVEDGGNKQSAV